MTVPMSRVGSYTGGQLFTQHVLFAWNGVIKIFPFHIQQQSGLMHNAIFSAYLVA